MTYDHLSDRERRMLVHVLASLSLHIKDELNFWRDMEPETPGDPDFRDVIDDHPDPNRFWVLHDVVDGALAACMDAMHPGEAALVVEQLEKQWAAYRLQREP